MAARSAETSLYLVTYDIPSDRRRNKVHQILTGFGEWVQYSVFECHLTKKELLLLRTRLDRQINPQEDNLRIYTLCEACLHRVETVGSKRPAPTLAYLL
jgi:CRISPR-associated protein Cas2